MAVGTAIRREPPAARWDARREGPSAGHRGPEGRRPLERGAAADPRIQPRHAPARETSAGPRPPPGDLDPRRASLRDGPRGPGPYPPDDLRLRSRRRPRAHVDA